MSESTKTGTSPFWTIGLTVVGKPAATVITSSPGRSARSPSSSASQRAQRQQVRADDPQLTRTALRTPIHRANSRSNCAANRPVVSQKSSEASTRCCISSASNTLPDTGNVRLAGEEVPVRERGGVVLADELQDPGAQLGGGVPAGLGAHRRFPPLGHASASRYHGTVRSSPASSVSAGVQPSRSIGLGRVEPLGRDLVRCVRSDHRGQVHAPDRLRRSRRRPPARTPADRARS